uniref:Uncharacterized protein n=1 Tax=Wuchereria bancrofti TaxID=6293 RepID=A0AAF5PKN5_WUCBA
MAIVVTIDTLDSLLCYLLLYVCLILDDLICEDFRIMAWLKTMSMTVIVWTPLRNIVVVGRYLITGC